MEFGRQRYRPKGKCQCGYFTCQSGRCGPVARVYPFAMAYVQSNFRLKIKQRLFYGLGGKIQLLNMNENVIKCSLSVVNETSKYVASEWNVSNYSYEEVVPKFVQQEDMLYTLGISYLFKK